jgi:hypothetical protein
MPGKDSWAQGRVAVHSALFVFTGILSERTLLMDAQVILLGKFLLGSLTFVITTFYKMVNFVSKTKDDTDELKESAEDIPEALPVEPDLSAENLI